MVDVQSAATSLLKNPQFMETFQRAMGGQDAIKDIPPEGDPRREKWLREIQKKIEEESKKSMKSKLEEVHSDENGQWMYILPEPGFCVKCSLKGGGKVFVNVCQHDRIAEPIPMEDSDDVEIKFKVPLSCGQARPDVDKSGKTCKVYDVIVNPSTIQRCATEHEFRNFVISLCIHWIKQKSEPTLNSEEFRNMNFKAKGTLEPQRIRLSTLPKSANALGDEIRLPENNKAAAPPTSLGGRGDGKLVQELQPSPESDPTHTESSRAGVQTATDASPKPSLVRLEAEGAYDWSKHTKPTINPYFRDVVPAHYTVEVHMPAISAIAEVDVRLTPKRLELSHANPTENQMEAFLTVPFPFPVEEDTARAKFVRQTRILRVRLAVRLPDEMCGPSTPAVPDAAEAEEAEMDAEKAAHAAQLREQRERHARAEAEETRVMTARKAYVENLAAVQGGAVPPALGEELDAMPPEQLCGMLQRLETRTRRGDSIDTMLEKFPHSMIDSICRHIRGKLGLAEAPAGKNIPKQENPSHTEVHEGVASTAPLTDAKNKANHDGKYAEEDKDDGRREYNFAKKAEKLFGVEFQNRYLFALD